MKKKGWMGIGLLVLFIVGTVLFFQWNKEGEEAKESSEMSVIREEKTEKESLPEEKKEEKKEENMEAKEGKEEKKEKEEEQLVTNPLDGIERSGNYWMMMNFKVTDKGERYEVVGDVYDAKKYSEWVDLVGSTGVSEEENIEEKSGLVKKQALFLLDKTTQVENDGLEGFEYPEQSLEEFLKNPYMTFLFDNKNDLMIRVLDWYMNYSG